MSKRCLGCMELYSDEYELCPHCGYIEGTEADESIHMDPGTLLHDRYIIGKVLGYGGFGVTYIGWDGKLEQKVAIKEYLPSEFSTRMPGQTSVTIFNGDKNEQFHDGLNKFIEEAKRLAKFQNEPGIVKVFDCFSENETAYIVMEYLDGETLTERLKREHTIPEDEAVRMLEPVMNSLQVVHQEGILHRDIAPDNIFLTKSGEVKLIDFGASRYATTSHSRSLTVIIKPGYSPEEQYRSRGDQGAYTDVYALAATMYRMITGKTPPDAMERRAKYESQSKDILVAPHKLDKNISINRENAILNAMNVRIEDRTPDVATFAKELNADPPAKRRYGKIKKLDLYSWPLWLKIAGPVVLVALLTFGVLLLTGVIRFSSPYSDEVVVPEGMVVVPNLEGMNRDDAWQLAIENQLNPVLGDPVESDYVTPGKIVLQTPNSGTYLEKYSSVTLSVGIGRVREGIIPNCDTCTEAVARERIADAGYGEPIIEYVYSDKADDEGKVVGQTPDPETAADRSTVITLYVSKGLAPFEMPDLVEKTREQAQNILLSHGINLKAVTFEDEKSDRPIGTVIRQEPSKGVEVTKDTQIIIYVSSGTGEDSSSDNTETLVVEDVVGKQKDEAVAILEAQGFIVSVSGVESDAVYGEVVSQTPKGNSSASKGTTISLVVSIGITTISVPDVAGMNEAEAISVLKEQGFWANVVREYSDSVENGHVIRQNPSGGSTAKYGDSITITVSEMSWSLTGGKLTISGKGDMDDYTNASSPGWEEQKESIKEVIITEGVTSIGRATFFECTNMTSIKLPSSLKSIGQEAFGGCSSLSSIELPSNVTSIGSGAFEDCYGLTSVKLSPNLKTIGNFAFYQCNHLISIEIPSGVTSIGLGLFTRCYNLSAVKIPSSVTSIGSSAFGECTRLTSIAIPSSVTSIHKSAFISCSGLKTIYFGGSAEEWKKISAEVNLPSDITIYFNSMGG